MSKQYRASVVKVEPRKKGRTHHFFDYCSLCFSDRESLISGIGKYANIPTEKITIGVEDGLLTARLPLKEDDDSVYLVRFSVQRTESVESSELQDLIRQ